jgi:hypothetical protein
MDDHHLIFLSYASPDRDRVFEFHDFLVGKGFQVWMDKRNIKGGQNWDFEIKRALQKAAIIVVFLSQNSVNRRGYAQREIKIALDQAREKLIDDIYLLPIMLDADVPIPVELQGIQVVRPEDGNTMDAAAEAIDMQLVELGAAAARLQGESELRWALATHKDSWQGLPGYDTEYQFPRFQSDLYPQVSEITDVIRGWLASRCMATRSVKYDQDTEFHNFGQNRFRRQNSWEATCGDPRIKEGVVSISYSIWWYGAGAAHPNQGFHSFAFTLDPVTEIKSLEEIFEDPAAAFVVMQDAVRKSLLAQTFDGMTDGEEPLTLSQREVEEGTSSWSDFAAFAFNEEGVDILFGSYHVAAYAFGPQIASVPYVPLARLMKKHFAHALGLDHLLWDTPAWIAANQVAETAEDKAAE